MLTRRFIGFLAVASIVACILTLMARPAVHGRPAVKAPASVARHSANPLGNLPLRFEQNAGQTDSRVKFLARGAGYSLFLTPSETVFSLQHSSPQGPRNAAVLRMSLAGADSQASVEGAQPLAGKVNYFIGNNPAAWHTNVPTFSAVRYTAVYPGVDMIFHGNQRNLEYDFTVAPGADPSRIAVHVDGASSVHIDASGDAILDTAAGSIRFRKPVLYQTIAASNRPVDGGYDLRPNGTLGFHIGAYDARLPLVIDPTISYSTYFGGALNDVANAMALDSAGDMFFAGTTSSIDFPVSTGAFIGTNPNGGSGPTAFVTELNPAGSAEIFSTYLGGSSFEMGNAMAVDSAGLIYVAGLTGSTNFPTVNAYNPNPPGLTAGFISVFNPSGATLFYSTYLGGSVQTDIKAIAVDTHSNVYVTGQTTSVNGSFPLSSNAFQNFAHSPTADPFVTELSTTVGGPTGLIYSSFLGGSAAGGVNFNPARCDSASGIAIDSSGNIYLTGTTFSTDYPTTSGAFQTALNGTDDAYFSKLLPSTSGAGLLYSTYLGGSSTEAGTAIALDSSSNAYITGYTASSDFPVTPGVFQNTLNGGNNGFIAKFNPTGNPALVYSTYVGGSAADFPAGIAVDSMGDAYIAGQTFSNDYPTFNPVQPSNNNTNGTGNAFATEINPAGSNLLFSTYLGGSGTATEGDGANAIAIDALGDIYLVGFANSTNFPIQNPFQASNAGMSDAFVTVIVQEITDSPSSLTFTVANIGVTAPPQNITVTNTSNAAFTATVALTGMNVSNFFQTNNCNVSIPPLGTCTVTVTFTSSGAATAVAVANITTNGGVSAAPVALTGVTTLPSVFLNPTSLTFASQLVGTSSPQQKVTLINNGGATLTLNTVAITGTNSTDFIPANTCPASIAPGVSCSIFVTFKPTNSGTRTANLTLTDSALNSPQNVPLTGTGTFAPAVTLSPTSLTFAAQAVGTSSAAQTITLTNTGGATLTLIKVATTGTNSADFIPANHCAGSIPAGTSCSIMVTFKPTATGTRTANLTITDNAPNSPQNVPLTGTGTATAAVTLSPTSLTFASQLVGTSSAAQTITLTNTGGATLTLIKVATTGTNSTDFIPANRCPGSIPAGTSCSIMVTFKPTATGTRTANLTITDSAPNSPQNVPLTGTGANAPAVTLSPTSLTFAGQKVGTSSTAQTITLTNTGGATLTLIKVSTTGTNSTDFIPANRCPGSIPAGTSCSIMVTFKPTATGTRTANLTITDNAPNSPQNVPLTGTGQ